MIPSPSKPPASQVRFQPGTGPINGLPSIVAARAPVHVRRMGRRRTPGTNLSQRSITFFITTGSTAPALPGLREEPRHNWSVGLGRMAQATASSPTPCAPFWYPASTT